MLLSASYPLPRLPKLSRCWRLLRQLSIEQAVIFALHFLLVVLVSVLVPLFVRGWFAAKYIQREEPLDFTFQTCSDDLVSVCSFPEAVIALDEGNIELQPGYFHSFELVLTLFDTQQNRKLGLFVANLQVKDAEAGVLANYNRAVHAFKSFRPPRSTYQRAYTTIRNLVFLPLYALGAFSNSNDEEVLSDEIRVLFPQLYLERWSPRGRFLVLQLQNKMIQLASASLRIETRVGLWCYFISAYPFCSYAVLAGCCFTVLFAALVAYWSWSGIKHCVNFLYLDTTTTAAADADDEEESRSGKKRG